NNFIAFAKTKNAEPDSAEVYKQSIPVIKNQLKGLIGQNLFDYSVYYQITNIQNPIYKRALEAFEDKSFKEHNITPAPFKKEKNKRASQ
ncbi:MAG TPA: hypothetical protein PLC61_00250, partial [Chitinophagales bacterium]|nr:hypothetical protein [Chitinophagales bacterium]